MIDRRIRAWFCFLIYTSVLPTRLASKNGGKMLRAIHPSCYFGDVYLTILNNDIMIRVVTGSTVAASYDTLRMPR